MICLRILSIFIFLGIFMIREMVRAEFFKLLYSSASGNHFIIQPFYSDTGDIGILQYIWIFEAEPAIFSTGTTSSIRAAGVEALIFGHH